MSSKKNIVNKIIIKKKEKPKKIKNRKNSLLMN